MKQYLSAGKEPNFQKIIITSAVLHLLFITLATMPLKTRDREYKSYYVNLVSPAALRSAAKEGPKTTGAGKSKTEKKKLWQSRKNRKENMLKNMVMMKKTPGILKSRFRF